MNNVYPANEFAGDAILTSLSAIKQAQGRLHLLTSMGSSPTILASQIELCDLLLAEISGIRNHLVSISNRRRGHLQRANLG
jgi:hypothetical protein